MQSILTILFSLLFPAVAFTQTTITGKVTDTKQQPLPGVNVYIKGTLDGGTTDVNGIFTFVTDASGKQTLIASMIGMESSGKEVTLTGASIQISITLKESVSELSAVEITAGSFSAGDVKKAAVLSSIDVATTAGATADVIGALQTLPGTLPSMEQDGLLVRGGDATESKAYFDGILVNKMFTGSLPDIAQRGRFSPFLFKGTSFSTGAYSARYGDALSSVMLLESTDVETESKTEVGIMSVGVDAGHVQKFKNSSLDVKGSYYNLKPVFALVKQNTRWTHEPESAQGSLFYKQKTGEKGLLKIYGVYENSRTGLINYNREDVTKDAVYDIRTSSLYLNTTWNQFLNDRWKVFAGAGFGNDHNKISIDTGRVRLSDRSLHTRVTVTRYFGKLSDITAGFDYMNFNAGESFNSLSREAKPQLTSAFAESNIFVGSRFTIRPGLRTEYVSPNNQTVVSPRISLALKLSESSQLSAGWGQFHQMPDENYWYDTEGLRLQEAVHTVVNYQYRKNNRTFRSELYYKDYRQLITTTGTIANNGYGHAKGLDLFWRDSKSIRYADYWISYSYLDTRRKYLNYPVSATPSFTAKHVLNLVGKYFISKIKTSLGATYTYASGRTYYNPNRENFLSDKTRDYHNFSLNAAYLTSVSGQNTIIYLSVENLFGIQNIYGYRYSSTGGYRRPITPSAPRSIFLGVFLAIR